MRINTYGVDPEGYRRLLAWNEHLVGSLPVTLRTLVEVRVSQINGCAFCLAMHADEARREGVPQQTLDVVAAWRDAAVFSKEERAGLALAEDMTRLGDGRRVDPDVWAAAEACFDDATLSALVQVVALINAFNLINVTTERTDEEYFRYAASRARQQAASRP